MAIPGLRRLPRPKKTVPSLLFPNMTAVYTQGFADATQWELHAGAGTIANNTTDFRTEDGGTAGVKLTSDGNTICAFRLTAAAVFASGTFAQKPQITDFWVWIEWLTPDNYANIGKLATSTAIQIEFANHQSLNNRGWTAAIDDSNIVRGWNHLIIHADDWVRGSANPALDWSDIISLRIRITRNATLGLTATFDALRCFNAQAMPAVVLNFPDDGREKFLYVMKLLKRFGMRGSFIIQTNNVGAAGKVTYAELVHMQNKGHMIGNQSNGGNLALASKQGTKDDLTTAYNALTAVGIASRTARIGTFPSNAFDEQALDAVDEDDTVPSPNRPKMLAMHGGGAGNGNLSRRHNIPPAGDDYQNSFGFGAVSSTLVATLYTAINNAVAGGHVIRIGWHDVRPNGAAADEMTEADFIAVLQYIKARNLPCLTESDLLYLQTQGVVLPQNRRLS